MTIRRNFCPFPNHLRSDNGGAKTSYTTHTVEPVPCLGSDTHSVRQGWLFVTTSGGTGLDYGAYKRARTRQRDLWFLRRPRPHPSTGSVGIFRGSAKSLKAVLFTWTWGTGHSSKTDYRERGHLFKRRTSISYRQKGAEYNTRPII